MYRGTKASGSPELCPPIGSGQVRDAQGRPSLLGTGPYRKLGAVHTEGEVPGANEGNERKDRSAGNEGQAQEQRPGGPASVSEKEL